MPSGMAHLRFRTRRAPSLSDGERISGKVAETMNAASYTYIRVQTNGKDVWAARRNSLSPSATAFRSPKAWRCTTSTATR
jgi:hypothetical protein